MDILPVNFWFLRFCGVWEEDKDRNPMTGLARFCYKCIVVTMIFSFTASQVVILWLTRSNVDDLTESLFVVFTFVGFCAKFLNFLLRQGELSALLDQFRIDVCQSKSDVEKTILKKYNRKAKLCTTSFMVMSLITGVTLTIFPLLNPSCYEERMLPFKMFLPYSIADPRAYASTYLYETITTIYGIVLNVSFDSLVYGLTIQACGQIDLLRHRIETVFDDPKMKHEFSLSNLPKISDNNSIEILVKHHLHVRNIGIRIETMFVWTVTILFSFSLVTLCTSIFQMSKKELFTTEFLSLVMYLGSMLFQVFCYCWYGNEFELKSRSIADSAYASDWTTSTPETRNSLRLIMVLGQKGLSISFHGIFAFSLATFTWILKTSYSAFNLLQNMDEL